jgi:uncharacterized protein (TIGR02145 family)
MKRIIISIAAGICMMSCSKTENVNAPGPSVPVVTTFPVSEIRDTMATCRGGITSDGGSLITAKGVCWSKSQNPTLSDRKTDHGSDTTSFYDKITGLEPSTTYYVRAYATNSLGTGYGSIVSFTTEVKGIAVDIDGNVYHTVLIGTQRWMVENLATTRFNDGTSIPFVGDNGEWSKLAAPGRCWYNNDGGTYGPAYGALYNWYAVHTGKLAPVGWHVPSDEDWTTLTSYLGGETEAGRKLKEAGTAHWQSVNQADNSSGFTALPGGSRSGSGSFSYIGYYGYWWSSTEYTPTSAWVRSLGIDYTDVHRNYYRNTDGYSVRCVKD